MIMDDVQQDDIFDRDKLKRALRFIYLKALQPVGATGTIATFEVSIPGLLKIKGCSLRRRTGEPIRLVSGRLDNCGGFAVELRGWLRDAVFEGAIAALRAKLQKDLVALAKDTARAEEADDDTAGLERVLSKAPATWLPKTEEPWLPR
jgi:hypothetical protein